MKADVVVVALWRAPRTGETKVSTSTVAALFSKMALTGQRIAMVDMVFWLVFPSISLSTVGVDCARDSL